MYEEGPLGNLNLIYNNIEKIENTGVSIIGDIRTRFVVDEVTNKIIGYGYEIGTTVTNMLDSEYRNYNLETYKKYKHIFDRIIVLETITCAKSLIYDCYKHKIIFEGQGNSALFIIGNILIIGESMALLDNGKLCIYDLDTLTFTEISGYCLHANEVNIEFDKETLLVIIDSEEPILISPKHKIINLSKYLQSTFKYVDITKNKDGNTIYKVTSNFSDNITLNNLGFIIEGGEWWVGRHKKE